MKRAYVDSSVWIARFEGLPRYQSVVSPRLTALLDEGWLFCASDAIDLEVLVKPRRDNHVELLDVYQLLFQRLHHFANYDDAFKDALRIAAMNRSIVGMDAIHVAFAVRYECELFVTTDPHFKNLKTLPLHWIELSQSASV